MPKCVFRPYINIVVIFFIAYAFFYDLKTSVWSPLILTYLILLVNPVKSSVDFPKRLIALALGSLFLIITQLIINHHRARHDLRSNLIDLVKEISIKIDILINNKNFPYDYVHIEKYMDKILSIVNDRRDNIFYLNKRDNIRLNFALYIERLNYFLDEVVHSLDKQCSYGKLINEIDLFAKDYQKLLNYNYSAYEIIQNMSMLKFAVVNFANNKGKEKTNITNYFKISKILIIKDVIKLNFNFKSLRFAYAFKFAFLLSASFFFAKFFHLQFGYWITATLFAVLHFLQF